MSAPLRDAVAARRSVAAIATRTIHDVAGSSFSAAIARGSRASGRRGEHHRVRRLGDEVRDAAIAALA